MSGWGSPGRCRTIAWNIVPTVYLGQWDSPSARRNNVKGMIGVPEIIPFWNIEKT